MNDARKGIEFVKSQLEHETIHEQTYWFIHAVTRKETISDCTFVAGLR